MFEVSLERTFFPAIMGWPIGCGFILAGLCSFGVGLFLSVHHNLNIQDDEDESRLKRLSTEWEIRALFAMSLRQQRMFETRKRATESALDTLAQWQINPLWSNCGGWISDRMWKI